MRTTTPTLANATDERPIGHGQTPEADICSGSKAVEPLSIQRRGLPLELQGIKSRSCFARVGSLEEPIMNNQNSNDRNQQQGGQSGQQQQGGGQGGDRQQGGQGGNDRQQQQDQDRNRDRQQGGGQGGQQGDQDQQR